MKNVVGRALTAYSTVGLRQISLTFLTEGIAVVVNGGVEVGFSCVLPATEMFVGPGLGGTIKSLRRRHLPHVVHDGHSVEGDPTAHSGLRLFINLLVNWLTETQGPIRVRPICGAVGVVVRC